MTPTFPSKLFQPTTVGRLKLAHRVVLAPLTRLKASKTTHILDSTLVSKYYTQRSSTPGTFLISEATIIAPQAAGWSYAPGIWTPAQISAWKSVVEDVHKHGSFIYLQLWALGRAAITESLREDDPSLPFVAPSPIPISSSDGGLYNDGEVPRPLSEEEIQEYVRFYAQAARNGVEGAGFDGVEIHAANGYLIEQFLQDGSNRREDQYGGSIENRSRFGLEVVDAVAAAIGEDRTAVRLSPWKNSGQDMGMENPIPQYTHFVSELKARHPNLAYLHVIEPRVDGNFSRENISVQESNDFIREIWAPRPLISSGGYRRGSAIETADEKGDLIAFGRWFIANPDLPKRLKENTPLNPYDRKTFYVPGDQKETEVGYIDYPFASDSNDVLASS